MKNFQAKLHIDEFIRPVAQPHLRNPFHIRKQVGDQLEIDEERGVIERVRGPSPWVSPVVVVPKPKTPGQVRLCVDMRRANAAVSRERHVTPTINEIIHDLNESQIFLKI